MTFLLHTRLFGRLFVGHLIVNILSLRLIPRRELCIHLVLRYKGILVLYTLRSSLLLSRGIKFRGIGRVIGFLSGRLKRGRDSKVLVVLVLWRIVLMRPLRVEEYLKF